MLIAIIITVKKTAFTTVIIFSCLLVFIFIINRKEPDGLISIAFSQSGYESRWRIDQTSSIISSLNKNGYKLKTANAESDHLKQLNNVRAFIASGYDIIIISPLYEEGWSEVLSEAYNAGIKIILIDRGINIDKKFYHCKVHPDFIKEGELAALWFRDQEEKQWHILEMSGTEGTTPSRQRSSGFQKIINNLTNAEIVQSVTGDFSFSKSKEIMHLILLRENKINAVFCHNDEMAYGVVEAVKDAGLTPGVDIAVVTIDTMPETIEMINSGVINHGVVCSSDYGASVLEAVGSTIVDDVYPSWVVRPSSVYSAGVSYE
jgi:ABC-type sugar transport system substrate-binding protein